MNPIKLLQLRQAQTRWEYAVKQSKLDQEVRKFGEYRFVGYDAEQGKAIVTNGSDTVTGDRITNGAIKPNQAVRVTQAGRRVNIDSMPRPKVPPKPKPETPKQPSVQTIFEFERVVYLGGDRRTPIALYALEPDEFIVSVIGNNQGNQKHLTGLVVGDTTTSRYRAMTIANGEIIYERSFLNIRPFYFFGNAFWSESWGYDFFNGVIAFPGANVETGGSTGEVYNWTPIASYQTEELEVNPATRFLSNTTTARSATIPVLLMPGLEKVCTLNNGNWEYFIPLMVGKNGRSCVYIAFRNLPGQLVVEWIYYDADRGVETKISNGSSIPFASPTARGVQGIGSLINGVFAGGILGTNEEYRTAKTLNVPTYNLLGEGEEIEAIEVIKKVPYFPILETQFPNAQFYFSSYHP